MGMAFSSRSSSSTLKQTISTHITCKKRGQSGSTTVLTPSTQREGGGDASTMGWVPSVRVAPAWPAGSPGSSATGRRSFAFLPGRTTAVRTPGRCGRGRAAHQAPLGLLTQSDALALNHLVLLLRGFHVQHDPAGRPPGCGPATAREEKRKRKRKKKSLSYSS